MSADSSAIDPDHAATLPPAGAPLTLPPADAPLTLPQANALPAPDRVTVPGYEIIGELGRGGMGVVYKARQVGLNRDVALKMILAGGHASATDLARFKSEAAAVAKLQHPNVVQIYEVGEAGGLPYFSLEYCPGGSLEKTLAGVPQPPREAAALIETLARAVHAAHQAGIVHRDLKPANVLLSLVPGPVSLARTEGVPVLQGTKDQGQGTIPKITDFGLAKQIDSGSGRTATGAILGTPSYMAPEQANSSTDIGPAADTYALGAILYELLAGRPPFRAATNLDTILQVVGSDPVPPTRLNPQVPRDLETIALKCLQKEPAKRYPSAAALADDLHRWQAGEPIAARPASALEKATKWAKRRPAVAMLSAAVVLALAGGFTGILYELRIANDARARAETQEGLATQRADDLAKEQVRVRRELHGSDLLRADLLLQGNDFLRAEPVLWRSHFTRPDDDDRRALWRLWELYHQRPRRAGIWIGTGIDRLSADGRRMAVIGESKITIYDAVTESVTGEVATPPGHLANIFLSRDGGRLAQVSGADGTIAVWDLNPAPALRATLPPVSAFQSSLSATLGGALLDLPKEQLREGERLNFFGQTGLCFLTGDRVLVTGPQKATLWTLDGPAIIAQCGLERVSGFASPPIGGGGASLPSAATGNTIPVICGGAMQLWDLPPTAGGSIVRTKLDFTDPARFRRLSVGASQVTGPTQVDAWAGHVLLSPDEKWLITYHKGRLRVWDIASGEKLGEVQDGDSGGAWVHYSPTPDGKAVRAVDSGRVVDNGSIRLWRLPGLEPIRTVKVLDTRGFGLRAGFSPDGKQTVGIAGNMLAVYDHEPAEAVHS